MEREVRFSIASNCVAATEKSRYLTFFEVRTRQKVFKQSVPAKTTINRNHNFLNQVKIRLWYVVSLVVERHFLKSIGLSREAYTGRLVGFHVLSA